MESLVILNEYLFKSICDFAKEKNLMVRIDSGIVRLKLPNNGSLQDLYEINFTVPHIERSGYSGGF